MTILLQDLAQRIRQHEAELDSLRREHHSRQKRLTRLTRHKKALEAQLDKIEAKIQAVDHVSVPAPVSATAVPVAKPVKPVATAPAPKPAKPAAAAPAAQLGKGMSLAQFITDFVEKAQRVVTGKEIADELVRIKYPTASLDLPGMVETRVSQLVRQGILRRLADRSGVLPAKTSARRTETKTPTIAPRKTTLLSKPAVAAKSANGKKQTLQEAVTRVLAKSTRPLNTQELADRVLAAGYETKSKDLKNVLWVNLGKMDNVVRLPGSGYQLKR